ncbi:MAG: hypothetical protein GAK45_01473 [Pseudomonas citronellolis]|nr:MAG: hypothetical protein GAK45_01473 [Pseudomonas citronellolis]
MKHSPVVTAASRSPSIPTTAALLPRAWRRLRHWQRVARQRRQLAAMSDEMLKDIGLSRADVLGESETPFWRDLH